MRVVGYIAIGVAVLILAVSAYGAVTDQSAEGRVVVEADR